MHGLDLRGGLVFVPSRTAEVRPTVLTVTALGRWRIHEPPFATIEERGPLLVKLTRIGTRTPKAIRVAEVYVGPLRQHSRGTAQADNASRGSESCTKAQGLPAKVRKTLRPFRPEVRPTQRPTHVVNSDNYGEQEAQVMTQERAHCTPRVLNERTVTLEGVTTTQEDFRAVGTLSFLLEGVIRFPSTWHSLRLLRVTLRAIKTDCISALAAT